MRMPLWLNLSSFSSGAKRKALVNHEVNAVPAHQSSVASIIMRAVMTFHRCINNGAELRSGNFERRSRHRAVSDVPAGRVIHHVARLITATQPYLWYPLSAGRSATLAGLDLHDPLDSNARTHVRKRGFV